MFLFCFINMSIDFIRLSEWNSGYNATLPNKYALILIIISIVLTILAGFIPAKKAAKQDPVVALRTEWLIS